MNPFSCFSRGVHIVPRSGYHVRRALLANLVLFGILFGFHIVAAALEWELVFSLVAGAVSLQILFFGPLTVAIAKTPDLLRRRRTNRVGFLVSIPLALGLAWAYGGMAWSLGPVGLILLVTLTVHLVADIKFRSQAPESEMAAVGGLK